MTSVPQLLCEMSTAQYFVQNVKAVTSSKQAKLHVASSIIVLIVALNGTRSVTMFLLASHGFTVATALGHYCDNARVGVTLVTFTSSIPYLL